MFYSYKPYLQIALTRECIVTFDKNGVYIAKTQEEEKLLREYAENTRNSYNIRANGVCRAGGGKAGDSETSTTGSTAFSDRIAGDIQ